MSIRKLTKVVIVGRPNVGKSSLFNRIVGSRKAIVEPTCGTTRDRLYADIVWKGKSFTIVDTGGFEEARQREITALVLRQLDSAVEEADIIFFVTDSTAGIAPQDRDLASRLRVTSKKIFLIANKVDDGSRTGRAMDFYELGLGEPYAISALNSIGIGRLLDDMVKHITVSAGATPALQGEKRPIGIAIVGRPNVGKSSFINSILKEDRVIVHTVAGTTRDAVDIDFNYKDHDYILIDTAGMRHNAKINESADFYGTVRSREALKRADIAIVMIDGFDGLREDDARIVDSAIEGGKALVVAVNKSDLINMAAMEEYNNLLMEKMNSLRNYPVIFISCKTGKNVMASLDLAESVYKKSGTTVGPEKIAGLLETLKKAVEIKNKGVTLSYLKQTGILPPVFIIGIKCSRPLPEHLKRQMENILRKALDFKGVPVRVTFDNRWKPGKSKPRKIKRDYHP